MWHHLAQIVEMGETQATRLGTEYDCSTLQKDK